MLGKINLELNKIATAYIFANKSLLLNQELDIQNGIVETKVLLAKTNYKQIRLANK